MRQRENDQRRHDHTQQDQPPWRARRRLLAWGQPEQQPNGRKRDHARRRRRDPQQPPDYRQRGKRGQEPRRGESERTEGEHYPYPSAVMSQPAVRRQRRVQRQQRQLRRAISAVIAESPADGAGNIGEALAMPAK